ncbi:hypothetical protein [Hymenobacter glacieicola]|uniref:Uncharacterized protein n=1 Tax=Hymenobacter glacieicola TaxID=1562124 RepID=A0ABQ1X6R2_9BACT|nr:hypothetical protein [Hymenobacter glacieicola]GGG61358.1 hypothetical protein GCM10011378_41740 [Hymenobacter glacieicola]
MTLQELEEIFEQEPTMPSGIDRTFEGLKILSKYTDEVVGAPAHDIIYSIDVDTALEAGLTKEEAVLLRQYNWGISEEYDCFYKFV